METHNLSTLELTDRVEPSGFQRIKIWLRNNWVIPVAAFLGLYAALPFAAPVFMQMGIETPARLIYMIYSTQCHQLPERSFFLFGQQGMYSLREVQAVWQETINPLVLRQFIGNTEMGWKVAWSDRMVAMYTSAFFLAIIWWIFRDRIGRLPWWGFVLLLVPMALDGTSHFISDLAGIGQGFRDQNLWLAKLTNYSYPTAFYSGDALGSFNSWMRLTTGILFGLAVVWFGFPYLNELFGGLSPRTEVSSIDNKNNL